MTNRRTPALLAAPPRRDGLAATFAFAALLVLFSGAAGDLAAEQGDSAVLSGGGGEFYIVALPPDWVVNGQSQNSKSTVSNWVPRGQPGENWRELISLQIYSGLDDFSFAPFLESMIARYRGICDEVFATDIEETQRNRFQVAFRILACTKSTRTGLGEISMIHVVSGRKALYVTQRVYRVEPFTAQSFPLAGEQLNQGRESVEFGLACERGSESRACPSDWLDTLDALDAGPPIIVFAAEG